MSCQQLYRVAKKLFSKEKVAVTLAVLLNFIPVEDAGADDIMVPPAVPAPDAAWTIPFAKPLLVPQKAPDNNSQLVLVIIQPPSV